MSTLIPIKYNKRNYPSEILCTIEECAGHFDRDNINPKGPYSLHTEYSFGTRNLNNSIVKKYHWIKFANKNKIPQLWFNNKWSSQFADFVIDLIGHNNSPTIIEIHPPFDDYCSTIPDFIERYSIFEEKIVRIFPDTKILLENRFGSLYKNGNFLIAQQANINNLCELLDTTHLRLGIVLDIPQLFTSHGFTFPKISSSMHNNIGLKISSLLRELRPYRQRIISIHLWGKKLNSKGRTTVHVGDLNSYFLDDNLKNLFLRELFVLFNDNQKRYFVAEVNSSDDDLKSIISDLTLTGFCFA